MTSDVDREAPGLPVCYNTSVGSLFLVATPIGNLEDITLRALRMLRQARLIAAEDTRQTRKLLSHFDIHTPLVSYHEHNKLTRLDQILSTLAEGDVALVSDAGTPGLNDPGYELVRASSECRPQCLSGSRPFRRAGSARGLRAADGRIRLPRLPAPPAGRAPQGAGGPC